MQDKYFHIGCFKCAQCNTSLAQGGFFAREGAYYCTKVSAFARARVLCVSTGMRASRVYIECATGMSGPRLTLHSVFRGSPPPGGGSSPPAPACFRSARCECFRARVPVRGRPTTRGSLRRRRGGDFYSLSAFAIKVSGARACYSFGGSIVYDEGALRDRLRSRKLD